MKRIAAALVAAGMALSVVPAAAAAEATELTGIRTGLHAGFDRVVFDLAGPRPSVSEYRTTQPDNCGSGKPISAKGDEFLVVSMQPANAHGYAGPRAFETPGLSKVRSVSNTCDFEAHLDFAIGYAGTGRAYTISFLDNPTRVVVDIDNS
ncbi:AMIN-like domain-containing (lipo)protein [Lentzea sp. E54]|uniref:AMIN-like domain-containing (lipo)protein n=1 Tax=Lentzea xerophila TaxID=3435883 RepID=UPI003DA1F451